MLSIFTDIWHGILSVPFLIADFLVMTLNGTIAALAAAANLILALLPSFPDAPEPSAGILGFLTWVVPLGAMVSATGVLIAMWMGFLGVKVALKWVKAL